MTAIVRCFSLSRHKWAVLLDISKTFYPEIIICNATNFMEVHSRFVYVYTAERVQAC
jgi:hypothetical protein